ncbi:MAG: hypothetical protein JXA89_19445, partial [Anaerolineae bacterium]|nr:hypothetical protein [Anaerolineae bacterium]
MKQFWCISILLLVILSACQTVAPTEVAEIVRPEVELISPPSGARVALGEELEIETKTTDKRGLARIELWVDDEIYRVDEVDGSPSFLVVQRWRAGDPGEHKLTVKAVNADEHTSVPLTIVVEVLDPALFTATPTNTP